jgi:uncharacterized membrane protein
LTGLNTLITRAASGAAPVSRGRHSARRQLTIRAEWAFLLLLPALAGLQRLWVAELFLFGLLLVLPGVLLLRALRVPGAVVASSPVYVPAASLAVLIVSGLVVDVVGPLVGVSAPLRTVPLAVGIELVLVGLFAASFRAPAGTAIPWRAIAVPPWRCWPLLLPLVAAVGALRLNTGHSSSIAVVAVVGCLAVLAWAIARAPRLSDTFVTVVVYAVSLSVMWAYSLRGALVYGFDISTEYHAMHETVLSGVWHFSHPGDAYGALPAVTVLPAELHFLTGASDLMVLKLLYPAITAMFPVGIYSLGRKVIESRWALVAASFIVVQNTFAQELPALARQEIALVFFIAALAAIFESRLSNLSRLALAAIFGLGMVVSHYSTTYFAIGMLALFFGLQFIVSWFRDAPRVSGALVAALVAAIAGAAIWYGPVTQSAANVSQFVNLTTSQGFDLLPNQGSGGLSISSYLSGNTSGSMSAARYQKLVAQHYAAQETFVRPLPDASAPQYDLRDDSAPEPPTRLSAANSLVNLGEVLAEELAELAGAVAAIVLALRKKTPLIGRQLALLGAGTLIMLVVIRLSGTVAAEYNPQRALIQAFAVLGITMAWTLQGLTGWLRRSSRLSRGSLAVTVAATLGLAVIFAQMSGLAGAAIGGGTGMNLANSGEDFERYNMTVPELAAARWLGGQVQPGELVYADRYGELRLNAETAISRGLLNDITPLTLDQNAWVYATQSNLVDGRARQLFDNSTITYAFPLGFLDANFNVVYANGSSEVFRG